LYTIIYLVLDSYSISYRACDIIWRLEPFFLNNDAVAMPACPFSFKRLNDKISKKILLKTTRKTLLTSLATSVCL
jgi:hypothetical protein